MTRQSTFKSKIRARMAKTGERYAAARLALLGGPEPASPKFRIPAVPGYRFVPGVEPDLARLTSALAQSGVRDPATGEPFREQRLFGLSGGIGFMYFLFEYAGHPPMMTFVCRTWSMPGPVVERALDHAGVEPERVETSSASVARRELDRVLATNRAAHLTVDLASLPWSSLPQMWTGQMPRQLNVAGAEGDRYLVDMGAPLELPAAELGRARAACRKEKHRALSFAAGEAAADPAKATRAAARYTARSFVEAPYRNFAGNFGLAGLEKAARLCSDPRDPKGWSKVFSTGPLAFLALRRAWECATSELTAPAGGRAWYAEFLEEGARIAGSPQLREAAALARRSGEQFEGIAQDALAAGGELLAEATDLADEIEAAMRSGETDATERVRELRAQREALGERCTMDAAARTAAFQAIGARFQQIHAIEAELVKLLS